jgi:hypothetical protein
LRRDPVNKTGIPQASSRRLREYKEKEKGKDVRIEYQWGGGFCAKKEFLLKIKLMPVVRCNEVVVTGYLQSTVGGLPIPSGNLTICPFASTIAIIPFCFKKISAKIRQKSS